MQVGIESISLYTPPYFIDLKTIAEQRGEDSEKYYRGIGQEKMSIPAPDEDIVTLAANAAEHALQNVDADAVDTILFATESGIDQSKSAGIYVHRLLGLPKHMRIVELKQACYSGVGGMALALPYLLQKPDRKVLLIASDVARYGLGSAGEPTQGAGAVALVLSATPKLLSVDLQSGVYTDDVMDFWRPNYRDEALVDGKYSIKMYVKALRESWKQYAELSGARFGDFSRFAYHLPFVKMGEKAHQSLVKFAGSPDGDWQTQIGAGAEYQRTLGNTYAASVFVALASTLENAQVDLSGQKIGVFSYGSGCVGEFFGTRVLPGYQQHLKTKLHHSQIENRKELTYDEYADFYSFKSAMAMRPDDMETPKLNSSRYRFAGLNDEKRIYEVVD